MRLPRFIGHPNRIVFRVFKQKQLASSSALSVTKMTVKILNESILDIETETKTLMILRNERAFGKKTDNNAVVVYKRREYSADQCRLYSFASLEPKLWDTPSSTALVEFLNKYILDIKTETKTSMILRKKRCAEQQPSSIRTSALLVTKNCQYLVLSAVQME